MASEESQDDDDDATTFKMRGMWNKENWKSKKVREWMKEWEIEKYQDQEGTNKKEYIES